MSSDGEFSIRSEKISRFAFGCRRSSLTEISLIAWAIGEDWESSNFLATAASSLAWKSCLKRYSRARSLSVRRLPVEGGLHFSNRGISAREELSETAYMLMWASVGTWVLMKLTT